MIEMRNTHGTRFSQGRIGLHAHAGNLDDIAYLLSYLDKVNYQSLTGLEIDFVYNEFYLLFNSIVEANQFLAAWNVEQGSKSNPASIDMPQS